MAAPGRSESGGKPPTDMTFKRGERGGCCDRIGRGNTVTEQMSQLVRVAGLMGTTLSDDRFTSPGKSTSSTFAANSASRERLLQNPVL